MSSIKAGTFASSFLEPRVCEDQRLTESWTPQTDAAAHKSVKPVPRLLVQAGGEVAQAATVCKCTNRLVQLPKQKHLAP